jgi:hypothetical protein
MYCGESSMLFEVRYTLYYFKTKLVVTAPKLHVPVVSS